MSRGRVAPAPHADAALVAELEAALAPDRVRWGAVEVGLYKRDASTMEGAAGVVCFPETTAEVQACVLAARHHGRTIVPRGSGTGLAGGAVPEPGAVVLVTAKMNRILSVEVEDRVAWVQPGVLNLDLTRHLLPFGYHFAPDPSSQQSCSIGGNVSTNAGGPHCLAEGVTSSHVMAAEVVLTDGRIVMVGGVDPEPAGLDLRGVVVGGEGTLGMVTRIAVRITPNPPAVRTLLADFERTGDGAATVGAVIAAGIVPAAMEMMDRRITEAVEAYAHAGFPTDAAAVLIIEVDGLAGYVEDATERIAAIARAHGARDVRVAADVAERTAIWKGRKGAFGAIARVKPNYYLHDTVVPRSKLVSVLEQVYEIAARHDLIVMNVFHAGDGNLHPLLVYDRREPGVVERVHAAGEEIVKASVAAGGVLSGEHGIGLEKRDYMPLMFSAVDLEYQRRVRCAFDPDGVANPTKVLPMGSSCGEIARLGAPPEGTWI